MDRIVELATRYCEEFHEGQTRKNGESYSEHPKRVAKALAEHGYDDPKIQAIALLHDCVEDTDVTVSLIHRRFGFEIANGVRALSKNTITDATIKQFGLLFPEILNLDPKEAHERIYRVRLIDARKSVQATKEMDMYDNTRDPENYSIEALRKKVREATDFYIPLGLSFDRVLVRPLQQNIENILRAHPDLLN